MAPHDQPTMLPFCITHELDPPWSCICCRFGGGGSFFFHFSAFLFMLEISDSVRQSNFSAV